MDKLEKLFKKISKKERKTLEELIVLVKGKQLKGLQVIKLRESLWLRLRKRRLRIIFKYDDDGTLQIKAVKTRNERTYKNL